MRVAVVGGGAAGLMAAVTAARRGAQVTLIERNEKLGKKIYITGKGRCNYTNLCSAEEFLSNVVTNKRFLFSSINAFTPQDCVDFFASLNLHGKVERGNRVFPVSDKASDVTKALQGELARYNVHILYDSYVKSVKLVDKNVISLTTTTGIVLCDSCIIATGGASYPTTGSDGNGYSLAKSLGHTIIDPVPSLCGFKARNCAGLQGVSLKNVELTLVLANGKRTKPVFGEMLFTHEGISGPIAITLSSAVNRLDLSDSNLLINLKPALTHEQLEARAINDLKLYCNKDMCNALVDLLPSALIGVVLEQAQIAPYAKAHSITVAQRNNLLNALTALSFPCLSLEGLDVAIVTSGGVNVKEVDPKTMQSKLISNVYFAGEILDVDALTGGFSLQIAFATGYVAGINASQRTE